jgi:predicted dehydrogenase/sugar phosphate isomerase/epimerase
LTSSDGFALAGVCDLVESKARSMADEFDVGAVYTDVDAALADLDPQHVSVVTPPGARVPLVPTVLEAEPDSVVIEKPVANELTDVERIADSAERADTRVAVCHQTPWADELQALKSWIDDGRPGDVTRLVGSTKLGIAGQGTHFLHAMNWLLDDRPESVQGWVHDPSTLSTEAGLRGHVEPGDTSYELSYDGGARAFVHHGAHAPEVPGVEGDPLAYKLDVIGEDGRAEYVLGSHARGVFVDGVEAVDARSFDEDAYMTQALYDRLAAWVAGEVDGHPADLKSAVAVHRTIDAVLRSAIDHRPIDPRSHPPAVGASTVERVRERLSAERPIVVSSLLYGDRSRAETLDALSDLGVTDVDLWGTEFFVDHHFDPRAESVEAVRADLDERGLTVPVVSIYDQEPVPEKLAFAAELGADTAVMAGRTPERPDTWDPDQLREWLDLAADHDLTLAFENHTDQLETVDEMEALLEALDHPAAEICLAPSHLVACRGSLDAAITRLGDDIGVLYLWDMEPGVTADSVDDVWWDRPDSQVPGGGGAVEFERTLELAVTHAPDAHWVLCYHGTEGWDRDRIDESVARSFRYLERHRP